nr:monothiol glutaredoxin-S7, chloroplastic [Ipomoea batatas]
MHVRSGFLSCSGHRRSHTEDNKIFEKLPPSSSPFNLCRRRLEATALSSTVALQSQIAFTTAPLFVRAPTSTATPNVKVSLVHAPTPYCRALRCSTNRNSANVGRHHSGRTGSGSLISILMR